MFKKILLGMVISLALASIAVADSGPDIHEGEWNITVDFDMPGMPMKMPPQTYTQCIKKDNAVPKNEKPNQACVTKSTKIKGNTIEWTMQCNNPGGKMTGNGQITYHGDTMNGTMIMEGQGISMTSHYKGQRMGDCH